MRAVLVAVAAVLACAAVALAQTPGRYYGGGHLTGIAGAKGLPGSALVQAVVSKDAKSVALFVDASTRCASARADVTAPLNADGSFTGSRTVRYTADGVRKTVTATVQGAFSGETVSGTAKVKVAAKEGRKTRRCSGSYPFQLRAERAQGDPEPAAGPPQADATYAGTMDDGEPFVLRTDAGAAHVTTAAFLYVLKCRRAASRELEEYTPRATITNGAFALTEHFKVTYSDNSVERWTVKMAGAFAQGAVSGTARVTTVTTRRKKVIDRCSVPVTEFDGRL